jgi:hypothetical protein
MRSKQQNKLRRRISRRHRGGKPLEQLIAQVQDALRKVKEVEAVLIAVMDQLTRTEDGQSDIGADGAATNLESSIFGHHTEYSEHQPEESLQHHRDRVKGMRFTSLDTPQGMAETPTTQRNREILRDGKNMFPDVDDIL